MRDLIVNSRFWPELWRTYKDVPSIALCRVPEIEYASTISLTGTTLDHCCGDGLFAAIAWQQEEFTAGCDLNEWAMNHARRRHRHAHVDSCDAGRELPYDNDFFDLVFDNSALEHILDLDKALSEIARVTKPGGTFAFNVLNHRYFEWWPCGKEDMADYREWQPFFHALSIEEWRRQLSKHRLVVREFLGYFPEEASRVLALLDFEFSGHAIRDRPSNLVSKYRSLLGRSRREWKKQIEQLPWRTAPDEGAGYFIKAVRE